VHVYPTDEFMDRYVAPGYSAFKAATIPEAPEDQEQKRWVQSFLLNSTLRATLDVDTRRAFYTFLRRTEAAFSEYEEARRLTLAHLANPRSRGYINAIGRWERFLSDADRAWNALVRGKDVLFTKNDGTVLQRLRTLYNRTKHTGLANDILPVWLTNDGLEATNGKLTFAEIADLLSDLATFADGVQDPATLREKIISAYGLNEEDIHPWGEPQPPVG
jgi:hypothetical protein